MNTPHQQEKSLQRRVCRHIKAARHTFFAIVQPGFEETALAELQNLGVDDIVHTHQGGITFRGKVEDCYRVNLSSRVITRVLMRIDRFKAFHFNQVYKRMRNIPWELYLPADAVPAFKVSSSASKLFHTGRVEEEAAKAVGERLSEVYGSARRIDPAHPHAQSVYIRLEKNTCTISLDSTGDPLYKRGYKKYITGAPLRETTAAALLMEGGLAEAEVLVDPMCGSGTFSMEGAMMLCGRLPGEKREFPFFHWPVFSRAAYNYLSRDMEKCSEQISTKIICSDIDQGAIDIASKNILSAGIDGMISISRRDFLSEPFRDLPRNRVLCVLNPPYGKRLLEDSVVEKMYEKIGIAFREWYPDWGYVLLFPDEKYLKVAGLDFQKKISFSHGGLEVTAVVRSAGPRPA